jgi:hypothetical protein
VCKWCHLFNGGRTDVHNEVQSGCPSVNTEDWKGRVDASRSFPMCFVICFL